MNAQAETQSATMPRIDSVDLIRPFPLITSRLDRMRNDETPDRSRVPGRNGRSAYAGTIDRLFVNRRGSARGKRKGGRLSPPICRARFLLSSGFPAYEAENRSRGGVMQVTQVRRNYLRGRGRGLSPSPRAACPRSRARAARPARTAATPA